MGTVFFTVYGRPQPQGSSRAFIPKGWKRPVITSANKGLKPWRQEVAAMARSTGCEVIQRPNPVTLSAKFFFARPKSLSKKVASNTKKPDVDKLLRSLADSLTGICYEDDSQINRVSVEKSYGSPERTEIRVDLSGPESYSTGLIPLN